jgi:hypothetical protein
VYGCIGRSRSRKSESGSSKNSIIGSMVLSIRYHTSCRSHEKYCSVGICVPQRHRPAGVGRMIYKCRGSHVDILKPLNSCLSQGLMSSMIENWSWSYLRELSHNPSPISRNTCRCSADSQVMVVFIVNTIYSVKRNLGYFQVCNKKM